MQEHEASKRKSGRPSDLSLEAQILLALTYWREYRTLYHMGIEFGVHESSASRIVRKVEDVLIASGKFDLPRNLTHENEDTNWSAVIIDATILFHFPATLLINPKKVQSIFNSFFIIIQR